MGFRVQGPGVYPLKFEPQLHGSGLGQHLGFWILGFGLRVQDEIA